MKTLHVAAVVALIAAAHSIDASAHVDDADAAKVASCTFVKDVSAPTTKGKHTREALGAAMEKARDDAGRAGATHIVWDKIKGANVANVTGKAYHCGK